ncbi:unnamed protein product [Rotaria sp. Silwood2]|nr:unnamed protein product [Rotaria sp. Silwood2]CAF2867265.1 unnamed protein product [Rotaria sp. Silwood2]CAF3211744.1 unnamed protein product [Rotaria sp. Silwood2]CAF4390591.1 unnamed protein product [Rotaria sp. Silwood2]CAF4612708.1 unnamed protein product [Rotaria sp. Silwood2]
MSRATHPHNFHPTIVKQQYNPHDVWAFENQWQTKLFSCKPMSRCCFACFCFCCMGCKLAKRLGETTIIGCCPCSLAYLRTKLRTARRIEGSCCGDLCASDCCCACVATQMASELESQGMWDISEPKKSKNPRNERYNQYNGYN